MRETPETRFWAAVERCPYELRADLMEWATRLKVAHTSLSKALELADEEVQSYHKLCQSMGQRLGLSIPDLPPRSAPPEP